MSQKIKTSVEIDGSLSASQIANATTDTDKFLVSDGGTIKYRTGAELATDLGIAAGVTSKVQHQVKAGVAINKGQAVYVTGADGTNMIVGLASNATEATSSKTMGLLNATVSVNLFADVITEGLLSGLNTSAATVGDPIWLGTDGNLIYGLANKPYAPSHLVFIGIVTRVNANNGEIFVKIQNGFELNEIHDVDLKTTTPINGHLLGFNGTLWVNKTIAGWLGYTPQAQLNGTGFVKASGTTITYDNTSYYPASNPNGYISTYTETDTLASVTGRGASTTSNISVGSVSTLLGGGINLRNSTNSANVGGFSRRGSWEGNSNYDPAIWAETGYGLYFYTDGSATTKMSLSTSGNLTVLGTLSASGYNKTNWDTAYGWGNHASAGYVPQARTITINGTSYDLSANRSWTVTASETDTLATVTARGASTSSAITLSNSLTLAGFGSNSFINGTGDGSSFSTYNFALSGWSSMAFYNPTSGGTYPTQVCGLIDFREGRINMKGGFRANGQIVLHEGNFNSWAPTVQGGNASGTWPISITGNADTVDGFHGDTFFRNLGFGSGFPSWNLNTVDADRSGFTYSNNAPWTGPFAHIGASGYGLQFNASYGGGYAISYRTRNGDNGTWNGWYRMYSDAYRPYSDSANNSKLVDCLSDRTDSAYYQVAWVAPNQGTNPTTGNAGTYAFSCGGVMIQSSSGTLRANTLTSNGYIYAGNNYGHAVVGTYSALRFQGVFAMGDSWKLPVDGTSCGDHYGIAWSHPNAGGQAANLSSHGMLVQQYGVTMAAISTNIWCSGDVIAYSDARVKDNVKVIDNPLERIKKVRGVTFTRTDLDDKDTRHAGVIAQEMREALPEVVSENSEGNLSVSYGNSIALLIECIKEQQTQIDELKDLVNKLTNK
jgi:hypothetical protein